MSGLAQLGQQPAGLLRLIIRLFRGVPISLNRYFSRKNKAFRTETEWVQIKMRVGEQKKNECLRATGSIRIVIHRSQWWRRKRGNEVET